MFLYSAFTSVHALPIRSFETFPPVGWLVISESQPPPPGNDGRDGKGKKQRRKGKKMKLTIEVKEDLIKKYIAIGKKPWIEVTEAEAKEYKSIEYVIAKP